MAPAFSSTRQAAAFSLLLLVLLLLPAVMGRPLLPPREEIYPAITWRFGPFNHIRRQIFEEKADIDIVFIGSSSLWSGIDTSYVQAELSKKLGRPAVVLTLGWAWSGFDALYLISQDLLQHRKVRMLVFYDEYNPEDCPHSAAPRWFRFGDNAEMLQGLPFRIQASYYFAAVLGMPQNLISLIRPNLTDELIDPKNNHWKTFFQAPNSAEKMGALTSEQMKTGGSFVPFVPHGNARPADVCVYSPATKAQFQFSGTPLAAWQLRLAQKFAVTAREHGAKLVYLHLLPEADKTDTAFIQERAFWPEALHADVTMVGIAPARLYSGISEDDLPKLFYTFRHFNKNGQQFFTRLITPSLLQIYDNQKNR
jgi:hypothetical protein